MNSEANQGAEIYPIIWFQPEIDFALKAKVENKSAHLFSEFQKTVEFGNSLGISFLLIVPNDFDEQHDFNKSFYRRRLMDFEEEAILQEFDAQKSFRVDVFYTNEDFESEIFVEEGAMKWDVKELAKDFREEFTFWEKNAEDWKKADAVFERAEKPQGFAEKFSHKDYVKCKEFCIKICENLLFKKAREKKLMYYANLGESLHLLNEQKKALECFTLALDIVKSVYGEMNGSMTFLLLSHAYAYQKLDEYQKALEPALKALDLSKSFYGEQHAETALSYYCVASVNSSLKEYQKALEYHMKALEIRKSLYGDQNLSVAVSYKDVANMCENLNQYNEAFNPSEDGVFRSMFLPFK